MKKIQGSFVVAVLSIFICGRRLLLMIFDIPASKSMTKSGVSYMLIDGFHINYLQTRLCMKIWVALCQNSRKLNTDWCELNLNMLSASCLHIANSFLSCCEKKQFYLLKEQIFEREDDREKNFYNTNIIARSCGWLTLFSYMQNFNFHQILLLSYKNV